VATFKARPVVCPAHPDTVQKPLLWDYDPIPACPECGGPMESASSRPNRAHTVIGDECDVWIQHGLCNPDGTPRRYTSKSEIRQAEKALGWKNEVRHVGVPGSDKNPHTTRHF
jgi:hypothetical protein